MNLEGLDAIIFDFDGVLVDSVDVKTRAFAALYADHGDAIVEQVVDYHLHHGGVSRYDKFRYFQTEILAGAPLHEHEVADLAAAFSILVVDKVVAAPMVTGAQQFLDTCKDELQLFVVSATPTPELDDILKRRNLLVHFSGTWGSPRSKAQNIAALIREHDLRADRCVMIGDALADYEGAAANAVRFLGRVPRNARSPFSSDVVTFSDFTSLPARWDSR
jgi:phosphoglycolate phosphatase-like HAD superfamily hydrolase